MSFGNPKQYCAILPACVPDPIFVLVFDAVFNGLAQGTEPERLTDNKSVQRQRKHQRLTLYCSSISSN